MNFFHSTKKEGNEVSNKGLFIAGFWASFLFFFLQIAIQKILTFLLPSEQMPLAFSVVVSLFGFCLGVNISLWAKRILTPFYVSSISWTLLFFGGLLYFFINFYSLFFTIIAIFIPLGAILSIGFKKLNIYSFCLVDFLGASLGLATGIFFLSKVLLETQIIYLILISLFLSLFFYRRFSVQFFCQSSLLIYMLFNLFIQLQAGQFNLIKYAKNIETSSYFPDLKNENGFKNLKKGTYVHLHSNWSYTERVDVLKNLKNGHVEMYYNNHFWTIVADKNEEKDWYSWFSIFPKAEKALSIGSGGGRELVSLSKQANIVYGVEVNNATVKLMYEELGPYSGHIYKKTNVIASEGRKFLNKTKDIFDLIVLIYSSPSRTTFTTSKNLIRRSFLFSKEGISQSINRLTKSGYIVILTDLYYHGTPSILDIISSVSSALDNIGKDPKAHLAVFKEKRLLRNKGLLIIKNEPIDLEDLSRMKAFIQKSPNWSKIFLNGEGNKVLYPKEKLISQIILSKNRDIMTQKLFDMGKLKSKKYSDEKPFINLENESKNLIKSTYFVFFYCIFSFCLMFFYYIKLILKNFKAQSGKRYFFHCSLFLSLLSGLVYGIAEFLLIEVFNLIFYNHIFLIGTVLGGLLFGGAVASGLSSKMSLKTIAVNLFLLALVSSFIFFIDLSSYTPQIEKYGYLAVFVISFTLACAFSPLFPKILSILQNENDNLAPLIYSFNLISIVFGTFFAMLLYFYFGVIKASKVLFIIYLIFLIIFYIWFRAVDFSKYLKYNKASN